MAMKIQLRRITNAQRLALAIAPLAGEPIYCTDTKQMYVGDGSTLVGIPLALDWANLTNIPGYIDDVVEAANLAAFPGTGSTGLVYVALDSNKIYRWSGSTYVELSSAGTADTAVKLQTARTIALSGAITGSVAFDGAANVTIATTNTAPAPAASSTAPAMNGTAAVGVGTTYARADHVHASDTSRAPLASPALTGTPTAPTATDGTSTTQLATTAFVQTAIGGYLAIAITTADVTLTTAQASNPLIKATGALTAARNLIIPQTSTRLYAIENATTGAFALTVKTPSGAGVTVAQGKRQLVYCDGVNIVDAMTDFEAIALTGVSTAITATTGTNTTQIATTAFVQSALANLVIDGGTA